MNLDNLKPAWQKFQLVNSMQRKGPDEILFILETAEGIAMRRTNKFLVYAIVFAVFTFCFQGG